ncbi:HlyD family efflux transporter periplasmic adaptor subunit [Labedella populi]|uniref:HlyD family efflux transporter periplasmic adaptor subunit n=1 Tax=Labedella populi TaxID=2498850 RepID=A0A3S4DSY2_9MICO|nr:efflux RND transporter periplasmic adaptor subunit [Labedella populi]RWZ55399.1 HlyD family efflux transporter periplasmic adaptor subunit [Labedella populi]
MGVWRKWIFPIIRLLVFSIIAVALVKLAFFPDASEEAAPAEPTGTVSESIVTVERGSVINDVLVDGSIVADPAAEAKAPLAGDILELRVGSGATVGKGDVIAVVRKEIVQDPVIDVNEETGEETVTDRAPLYRTEEVTAPVAGVVSALPVVKGQVVEIGDTVASIAPPTFSVTGTIAPEEQYRLQEKPTEAAVEVVGGPGSFTCTNLTISVPLAGSAPEGGDDLGGGETAAGATVRCAVPGDVTVFSGLTGTISMPGGSAEDVLVLPVTAVKGNSQEGSVWLMGDDGEPVETPVGLGLNDGSIVEVSGIDEGASVLEFIPVDDPTDVGAGDGCIEEPDGTVFCDDGTIEG